VTYIYVGLFIFEEFAMDNGQDRNIRKRRVRPASETIRQQSERIKQEHASPKQKKFRPFKFLRKILSPLFRPLVRPSGWLYRHLVPRYLRDSFTELGKVTWPTRKQSRQLTFAVLVFACVFAFMVTLVDSGFDKIFKKVFLK